MHIEVESEIQEGKWTHSLFHGQRLLFILLKDGGGGKNGYEPLFVSFLLLYLWWQIG